MARCIFIEFATCVEHRDIQQLSEQNLEDWKSNLLSTGNLEIEFKRQQNSGRIEGDWKIFRKIDHQISGWNELCQVKQDFMKETVKCEFDNFILGQSFVLHIEKDHFDIQDIEDELKQIFGETVNWVDLRNEQKFELKKGVVQGPGQTNDWFVVLWNSAIDDHQLTDLNNLIQNFETFYHKIDFQSRVYLTKYRENLETKKKELQDEINEFLNSIQGDSANSKVENLATAQIRALDLVSTIRRIETSLETNFLNLNDPGLIKIDNLASAAQDIFNKRKNHLSAGFDQVKVDLKSMEAVLKSSEVMLQIEHNLLLKSLLENEQLENKARNIFFLFLTLLGVWIAISEVIFSGFGLHLEKEWAWQFPATLSVLVFLSFCSIIFVVFLGSIVHRSFVTRGPKRQTVPKR
jgi:hypothetical protein